MNKGLLILIIAAIAVMGFYFWNQSSTSIVPTPSPQASTAPNVDVSYTCDDDKTIQAEYLNSVGEVSLTLSDGRTLTLPQAMSADGARYANADESLVFWNVGDTAFLEEGTPAVETYQNCVSQ